VPEPLQTKSRTRVRLRSENLPYDIDVWYPSLASVTFRTEFLPLTRSEARAIVRYYHTR
jgi:hypothetical protein